jgi:pyridoxamine 5'-phosphate oxidase
MADHAPPEPPVVDPRTGRPPIVDAQARLSYAGGPLPADLTGSAPLALLRSWYADAVADPRVDEPNAMVLATVDAAGMPNARTVLLKGLDAAGFTFFTNLESAKGREIEASPVASLVLLWHPMHRQVRVRGTVLPLPEPEAATYFATRPRDSQVAAWASRQSQPLGSRSELERAFAEADSRFADRDQVPLPPYWGGYLVQAVEVEFWVGQASRLHDRLAYLARDGSPRHLDDEAGWTTVRRQP